MKSTQAIYLFTSYRSALVFLGLLFFGMTLHSGAVIAAETQAPSQKHMQQQRAININEASAKEISKSLSGIGKSKANAIVAYRDEHGHFTSLDDLLKVKGIGKKVLEKNKHKISL